MIVIVIMANIIFARHVLRDAGAHGGETSA